MEKIRLQKIDFLRAIAIIGMIAIHTFSYSLGNPLNKFIWDYLHFVVVGFIFCSGYILSLNQNLAAASLLNIFIWYKKRFIRLFAPFFLYLFVHFFLWTIFPQFFSGLGLSKNTDFILRSMTLTGGVGIGWLTLLFLQLTIISPIILKFWHLKKILLSYVIFSVIVTLSFTVSKFPYEYYRVVMWIPWSLILMAGIWIYKLEIVNKKNMLINYIKAATFSYAVFFMLLCVFTTKGITTLLIDHKYPPDFFNLSYGIFICSIILIIAQLKILKNKYIEKSYTYVSTNSYQLFFIHFVVLDIVIKASGKLSDTSSVLLQFLLVLLISITITFIINQTKKIFSRFRIIK